MIVVATEDFELYHDLLAELRERDAVFTTIEPGKPLPEGTTTVLTGADDDVELDANADRIAADDVEVVTAEPGDARSAVEAALSLARDGSDDGRLVVGVDPGERPGIAVLVGETVVAAFQVPLADAAAVIEEELAGAPDPVVRIGDGARLQGAQLVDALEDVRVELVDETGTTPTIGTGASGLGDVLAAVNIARRDGEPIQSRDVEPTPGELRVIKKRSRERSPENREIDERLARQVAAGNLSIREALEEHRECGG